jgi:tape measure domain-containing protein
MAGYNADIAVRVSGLDKLKLLEDRVSQLQGRFTKLNAAIANLGKFTQPKLNLNTAAAERSIQRLQREITGLNTRTAYVKVRLAYDSRDLNGRGGSQTAAAAAAAAASSQRQRRSAGAAETAAAAALGSTVASSQVVRGLGAASLDKLKEASSVARDLGTTADIAEAKIKDLYAQIGRSGGIDTSGIQRAKEKIAALTDVANNSRQAQARARNIESVQLGLAKTGAARVVDRGDFDKYFATQTSRRPSVVGRTLSTAGALVGAFGAAAAVRGTAQAGVERQTADLGLKANTEQYNEQSKAIQAVREQVKLLGLSQTEATKNFTAAYAALRPLGIQLETINQIQTSFIATSRASGKSVEESTAAWRQLVQAIGKGRLNGDELVSVMENAPQVAQQIAAELGVSVGQLKDLGEEGKLTSDKIVTALLKLRDPSLTKLAVILQGPAQQLKNLQNQFEELGVALGKVFGPAISKELKGVTDAVQALTSWVKSLTPETGALIVQSAKAAIQLALVAKAIQAIQAASGVVAFLRGLAATQVIVGTTAGGATASVNGLALAIGRLAAFGAITIAIKVAIDGLIELQRLNGEVDKLQGKNKKGAASAFAGASQETIEQAQKTQRGLLVKMRSDLERFEKIRDSVLSPAGLKLAAEKNAQVLRERIKYAEQILKLDSRSYPSKDEKAARDAAARQAEIARLSQGVPVPPPDGKDAKSAADKELKDQLDAAEKLAAEERQLQQQLAQNQIALDDQVFKNQIELIRQRYELDRELAQKNRDNWMLGFTGAGREQAQLINDLRGGLDGYDERIKELKQKISEAEQKLKTAQANVGVARMGQTPITVGDAAPGASAPGKANGYIDKSVLRDWLISQGFGRTSGDFTNKGHATPNHMLNAMDMGILGGSDAAALRRTSEMERRLAATGAFGDQLFGPIRDPYGHGAGKGGQNIHLHIPTPGGKVPLTPGLQALMGGKAPTGVAGATGGAVVGMTGQDTVAGALGDVSVAQEEVKGLKQQLDELIAAQQKMTTLDVAGFVLKSTDAFRQQGAELMKQTESLKLRTRLEMEGTAPELIEAEVQKLDIRQQLTEKEQVLQDALDKGLIKQEEYATALEGIREAASGAAGAIDQLAKAQIAAADPINKLMGQWNREINDVRGQYASLAQTVQGEIATAMSSAITNVITGTGTVQQAMSQMFKNIGAAFIEMATQMIAKAMVMKVLGIFAGGIGGGGGGGGGLPGFSMPGTIAGGGIFSGAGPYQFRASGGPVAPGGNYVVGEQGPELLTTSLNGGGYVHNAAETRALLGDQRQGTSMGTAMNRYSPANSLNQNQPGGSGEGGSGADLPPVLNITTGPVLTFEGKNYVSREDFQMGLYQASKQGAEMGEARTLRKLQHSASARRKLGMA